MTKIPSSNYVNIEMVEISSGSITLRDDRLQKKWTVDIQPFLLSKHLIIQDVFEKVMGYNPSYFKGTQLPVESISFKESAEFCNKLSDSEGLSKCYSFSPDAEEIKFDLSADGYRLPTEAEWEYACKAGSTAIRYGELNFIAWFKENSNQQTHPVGLKESNPWGLFDMLGNVWEWCNDLYDTEVYGTYRIFRGGGFSDEARSVMATTRRRSHPIHFRIEDLGFRIARNK